MTLNAAAVLGPAPLVYPAHPFAVAADGSPDWANQRLLTRYYAAAGASGVAVGVHTSQFELHHDKGLFAEALRQTAEVAAASGGDLRLVTGVVGDAAEAVAEAELAVSLGYRAALLSAYGMTDRSEQATLERARAIAEVLPVIGFYMQESVGGAYHSPEFWRAFFELDGVVGVKVAPFDRYRTIDVARALAESGRADQIALITGNDDTIVTDLAAPFDYGTGLLRFTGGLLGQWAVGTRAAVDLAGRIVAGHGAPVPEALLTEGWAVTEINQAIFDPEHSFAGAVAGVNELLRQQGLLASTRCLSERERLSAGQAAKITQVRERYPELLDETFIAGNIDQWRREVG